jgi:hypothetical protein
MIKEGEYYKGQKDEGDQNDLRKKDYHRKGMIRKVRVTKESRK